MIKNIFLVAFVFISSITLAGDISNGKVKETPQLISGKIIDKKSGEEIAGAEIKINDKIIFSDLNGNFSDRPFLKILLLMSFPLRNSFCSSSDN